MSLPQKTCTTQNAERLKNQGNELHQKRQYRAAYRKYSDAIKEDPTNAIYYANSAATSLALNECVFSLILFALPSGHRYMDASGDARKVTSVDPSVPMDVDIFRLIDRPPNSTPLMQKLGGGLKLLHVNFPGGPKASTLGRRL